MIFERETFAFSILDVIELEQGNSKPLNRARSFDALSYRIESDTIIESAGSSHRLCDNSICYVPAGVDYSRISKKDKVIVVHFNALDYHSKEIQSFYPQDYQKYIDLFWQMLDCWRAHKVGYRYSCSAILYKIFENFYADNSKDYNSNSMIADSVLFIKENFNQPDISIQTVADKSHMSQVYFRKLFKQEFGISPRKFIIEMRIKYAEGLIRTGYYSVKEVAQMCGFNDNKYFSTQFKNIVGVSPSGYSYK